MNELSKIIANLIDHGYQITFNRGKIKGCLKVELQRPELPDHLKLTVTREVSFEAVELANLDLLKYALTSMKKTIDEYKKDNE